MKTQLLTLLLLTAASFILAPAHAQEADAPARPDTYSFADVAPRQVTMVNASGEATVMTVPRGIVLDVTVQSEQAEVSAVPDGDGRSRFFEATGDVVLHGRRGETEVFSLAVRDGQVQVAWPQNNSIDGSSRF